MWNKLIYTAICLLIAFSMQAQKKVTYGKSTFTLYQPIPGLASIPECGFKPSVPGYTLKSKNYGQGTYYSYAPGNVPKTSYKCILTEIRDWIGYDPETVKQFATQKGLTPVTEKQMKKMFNNTRLPQSGLMYQLTENSWIYFYVYELQNCGPKAWSSNVPIVQKVSYIEQIPQQTDSVLNRLYRFWNDGVRFADFAGVNQSNFKTRPTAPTDQNPNNFAIGDVLKPEKGFYRLSFAGGGTPTYVWHSYEKVVAENIKKPDFDAKGTVGYNDLFTAFEYGLNAVKSGKNIYFSYDVYSRFLSDIEPGRTWQQEMTSRKDFDAKSKVEMQKVQKANEKALEMMYKEIFK